MSTRDDNGSPVSTAGTLADGVKTTEDNTGTKVELDSTSDSDNGTTVEVGKFDTDGILELVLAETVSSACEVESKIGDIDESVETIGYKDDVSSVMEAIEDVSEFTVVSVGFSIRLSGLLECKDDDELDEADDHVE